ncbi:sugar transporter [Phyllosticta citrichinensis]|uniref:Sugar transporter n=1 Tax=Phyllosticta citrichinensis TaxID=1130410 RepID=A0ABR1XSH1_9PEZI
MVSASAIVTGDNDISYGPAGYKGLLSQKYVLGMASFASIGGLLFGYDQGVISGVLVMHSFVSSAEYSQRETNLCRATSWMVSVLTLGAMVGAFINGPTADKFSRRWSLLFANIVFLVGSIIQAAAQSTAEIFVGRFLAGISIGMLSMGVPLYLGELAPPNIRGSLVALQQLAITIGIMVAFWLDYGTQYIGGTGLPLALQCLPSLIMVVAIFFLPYSPRWLVNRGESGSLPPCRNEEALETLCRLRRVGPEDPRVAAELMEIKVAATFDRENLAVRFPGITSPVKLALRQYAELFVVRHLNRRLIIACLLQIIQQFTGISTYAPTIFKDIGLSGNSVSLLATGVVGVINFFSTIPAIMYLDRWGRRAVLIVGGVGMSVAQLIVGTMYAVYQHKWESNRGAGWATAVFVWVYISNFAFSIGCVNWIMPSEIFPPGVRSKAVGVAISTNWFSNFIVALITPRMLRAWKFGTFYFFLVFCVLLVVWVWFFVPETKGRRIEEMDDIFGGNSGESDIRMMEEIRARLEGGNTTVLDGKTGASAEYREEA